MSMKLSFSILTCIATLGVTIGLTACANRITVGDAGADAGVDGGPLVIDGGPGEPCGAARCEATELCCPGCGPGEEFCAAGSCPDVSCPPRCGGVACGAGETCCRASCDGTQACFTECPPLPCL